MKKSFLLLLIAFFTHSDANAQDCFSPKNPKEINVGNVSYNDELGFWTYKILNPYNSVNSKFQELIYLQKIWIGGETETGEIRMAGTTYESLTTNFDFYPGPLDADGTTYPDQCAFWNRTFYVEKDEMDLAYTIIFDENGELNSNIDCARIPKSVLEWPGVGNQNLMPFIPDHSMADFYDFNADGRYNPCDGDLPALITRKHVYDSPKEVLSSFPLYMTYTILNDNGGPHRLSAGNAMKVELHNYTWGMHSGPLAISKTFSKHKVVNRGPDNYKKLYISSWADVIGRCDFYPLWGTYSDENMVFSYNKIVRNTGCSQGDTTYYNHPQMLGMSILEGFIDVDSTGNNFDSKMTSSIFTYNCTGFPDFTLCDPEAQDIQFYHNMVGLKRDGLPFTENDIATKFMHDGNPSNASTNAMCKDSVIKGYVRSTMNSGGGRMSSGGSNELILSHVAVFQNELPCPDISPLLEVQKQVVKTFENNWKQLKSIDQPVLNYIRSTNSIDFELSNDVNSNNYNESYSELIPTFSDSSDQYRYKFEGYKVYQVISPYNSYLLLDNPDFSKLVYQADLQNSIFDIDNYKPIFKPNGDIIFESITKVNGMNEGINRRFQIDWDYLNDQPIKRDGAYYYVAVAYAHNNYQSFDEATGLGQQYPYYENDKYTITSVLRTIDNEELAPQITRLHGMGTSNYLKITDASFREIINVSNNGRITYEINRGPFDVVILDKNKLKDGDKYQVEVSGAFNSSSSECAFEVEETYITVTNLQTGAIYSNVSPISESGEFVIDDLGMVIYLYDVEEPSNDLLSLRQILGQSLSYKDENGNKWLNFVNSSHPDLIGIEELKVNSLQINDYSEDLLEEYHSSRNHFFEPLSMSFTGGLGNEKVLNPATSSLVQFALNSKILKPQDLNNVDIVFTSDKSLWSRCIVVETASKEYQQTSVASTINKSMFEMKRNPSVDKNGLAEGGTTGLGWFPGYAIDVETGVRLNVFFGENTGLSNPMVPMKVNSICNDMLFNPSDEVYINDDPSIDPLLKGVLGGQHYIYITRQKYDECQELWKAFSENVLDFKNLGAITWAGIPILSKGSSFTSMNDGLIPNEVKLTLRVNNKFSLQKTVEELSSLRNCDVLPDNPMYQFEIKANDIANGVKNVENRSIPWIVQGNVNYFKLLNEENTVEVTLIDMTGRVVKGWNVAPNLSLEIMEDDLPSKSSIMFVRVKSLTSQAGKTYKLVVVK